MKMDSAQEIKDKALMWYFHPNELIRMMRCNVFENISLDVNLTPKYMDDFSIGVVIYSKGNVLNVDSLLQSLINENKIKNILIYSDGQNNLDQIQKLQNKYNKNEIKIEVYSTENSLWEKEGIGSIGEQNCFLIGLEWAKKNNLDILVKISETLNISFNWINDFKKLVKNSDGITFGFYDEKNKVPLKTNILAMNVNAWSNSYVIDMLSWFVQNEFTIFSDHLIDKLAKVLDYQNFSKKYENWKQIHKTGYIHSGYVHWNIGDKK